MQNKFYVYSHYTADTDEIFYVGKGCDNRCNQKTHRNKWWRSIVKAHGFVVKFIEKNLSEELAFELETFNIQKIGRRDLEAGPLVNTTDGGEGTSGNKMSRETRDKMSEKKKGRHLSEDHKQKLREIFKGKQMSLEIRKKISNSLTGRKWKGKPLSSSQKEHISEALKGRQFSEDHKQKLREARTGKHCTEETKRKIAETLHQNAQQRSR